MPLRKDDLKNQGFLLENCFLASGYWAENYLLLKRDQNSDLNCGVLIICSLFLYIIALVHSKFLRSQRDVREMITNDVGFQ